MLVWSWIVGVAPNFLLGELKLPILPPSLLFCLNTLIQNKIAYFAVLRRDERGPSQHVREFIDFLHDHSEFKVILYTNAAQNELPVFLDADFPIVYLGTGYSYLGILQAQYKAAKLISASVYSCVYARYVKCFLFPKLFRLRKRNTPVLAEVNTFPNHSFLETGSHGNLKNRLIYFGDRLGLNSCKSVYSVCRNFLQNLRVNYSLPEKSLHYIPNGFAPNHIPLYAHEEARKGLNFRDDQSVGVYIGSFSDFEGVTFLVKSLATRMKHLPENFICYLVGDGTQRQELEKIIIENSVGNRIRITGMLDKTAMLQYVAAADLCLYTPPPLDYGFCRTRGGSALKIVDYLSQGRPIILPNDPYYDYVDQYSLGGRFTPGDSDDFIRAINENLRAPQEEGCQQRIRNYAEEHLAYSIALDPLLKELRTLS